MRLLALSLVLALVACGGKSKPSTTPPTDPEPVVTEPGPTGDPAAGTPKATPSDAELDALFARSLDFFDELAVVLSTNTGDCKKMAIEIEGVFNRNTALLDEAKSYKGNPEVDQKADAYMQAHEDRLQAATGKMKGGMDACASDPDVQTVMKRFDDM